MIYGAWTKKDKLEPTKAHLAKKKITVPIVHDGKGAIFEYYGVKLLPDAILIGRDGAIEWRGTAEDRTLYQILEGKR